MDFAVQEEIEEPGWICTMALPIRGDGFLRRHIPLLMPLTPNYRLGIVAP
jgi:hypothetical protein